MDPIIVAAIITLIGVAFGALLGFFAPIISSLLSVNQEKDKWARDQKAEYNKWIRERLQEIYGNCLESLSTHPFDRDKAAKWLEILLIYYPNRDLKEYYWALNLIAEVVRGDEDEHSLIILHRFIVELAKIDPRLQGSEKQAEPSAVYWGTLGNIYDRYGKYPEAVDAYNKATSLAYDYTIAHYDKGIVLAEMGNDEDALKSYEIAINQSPHFKEAWLAKGDVLVKLKRNDEAVNAYEEVIRIDPNYAGAWNNRGIALKALGRTPEADAAFAKAKELGNNSPGGQP